MRILCCQQARVSTLVVVIAQISQIALASEWNWPIRRMSNVTGDIMLGALFPIHERNAVRYECGKLQDEGLQQLEALLYTLKKINSDPNLLPGVKLGVLALDSCDSTAYALEQTLDFIKGFIARNNAHNERQFQCGDGSLPKYRNGSFDRVVGIIGGQSSSVSIQLANLLRLFRVPQVSYQSTSPTLSNKDKYGYFFRTVPSDENQAYVILEILRAFRWTYVSVVYSDTDYGNKGFEKLQQLAPKEICFSSPQSVNVDRFTDADYDTVVTNLMHKTNARVVVVFADKQVARNVMAAAKRRGVVEQFVWIGSDAWGGRNNVVEGHEIIAEGSITVTPLVRPLAGFDDYFMSLTPSNNSENNPWFPEYWEQHFRCRLEEFPQTPFNKNLSTWCSNTHKRLNAENGYRQTPALHFVRDAVYAFAHALNKMHIQKCGGASGLCDNMSTVDGKELKSYLEKVNFEDLPRRKMWASIEKNSKALSSHHIVNVAIYSNNTVCKFDIYKDESGKSFRFLPNGDAPPRYSIINFQRHSNGSYTWREVGTYRLGDKDTILDLDMNAMRFKFDQPRFPRSFCSEPCQIGQAKLQLEGDTCCWLCTNCSTFQYLPDVFHCRDCPLGKIPSPTKDSCENIPEAYLSYTSPWAIGTMAFAGMGIVTTTLVAIVFWTYTDTPLIKASGRELSYLLLCGIFLSFSMTFVIVAKPAPCTCGITRFFLGFCYSLCYAAIVTKTNRIARIFNHRRHKPCHKPRYTSPRSQLVITLMLVTVEIIINTSWLLYDKPAVTHIFPTREENVLICLGSDTASYLVGLIYPFILMGFCTVYAFKTRKCPDGFNEARYLTFTNYTTCVIWLAFLPLFVLSTSNAIRAVTLSFLLSLSGAVQLACLFMPKVYIALFKPEKNTKESVMCHHNRNSSTLALPSSPMPPATPSILINGKCKDHYRLSNCSSSSPSSVRNSLPAPSPLMSTVPDLTLFFPEQQNHEKNNICHVSPPNDAASTPANRQTPPDPQNKTL